MGESPGATSTPDATSAPSTSSASQSGSGLGDAPLEPSLLLLAFVLGMGLITCLGLYCIRVYRKVQAERLLRRQNPTLLRRRSGLAAVGIGLRSPARRSDDLASVQEERRFHGALEGVRGLARSGAAASSAIPEAAVEGGEQASRASQSPGFDFSSLPASAFALPSSMALGTTSPGSPAALAPEVRVAAAAASPPGGGRVASSPGAAAAASSKMSASVASSAPLAESAELHPMLLIALEATSNIVGSVEVGDSWPRATLHWLRERLQEEQVQVPDRFVFTFHGAPFTDLQERKYFVRSCVEASRRNPADGVRRPPVMCISAMAAGGAVVAADEPGRP